MESSVLIALISLGGTIVAGIIAVAQACLNARFKKEEYEYTHNNTLSEEKIKGVEDKIAILHQMSEERNGVIEQKLETILIDNAEIKSQLKNVQAASIDSLRENIRSLYYLRLPDKALYTYEKESLFHLYSDYEKAGGNSFVHQIYQEMMNWDVVAPDSWRKLGGNK